MCSPVASAWPVERRSALSNVKRSAGVIFTSLRVWPSSAIVTVMSGRSSPLALR